MTQEEYQKKATELLARECAHIGAILRIKREQEGLLEERVQFVQLHGNDLDYTRDEYPVTTEVNFTWLWNQFKKLIASPFKYFLSKLGV